MYLISIKSEAFKCFRRYKTELEKQLERGIKVLKADRGGLCRLIELNKYCEAKGIIRHTMTNKKYRFMIHGL